MDKIQALRQMVMCINDLKRTQGTPAFHAVLRRLYRQAEMTTMPASNVEAVTAAVTISEVLEHGPHPFGNRRQEPPANYVVGRLAEIEEAAAQELGVSVEELRCTGSV